MVNTGIVCIVKPIRYFYMMLKLSFITKLVITISKCNIQIAIVWIAPKIIFNLLNGKIELATCHQFISTFQICSHREHILD
ncbi:hypothetical protein RS694_19455 [Rhodoferax saidenbachensis]|uniref:Uncharacterized protein n=1 Tax=Rhodoferax saidenbachensis TaxID=1484693 RepID=A0A1P8KEN9_9BURK|nr:hypothetical protein RS694_19455 [Rhodoferax saidenbachensis]